MTLSTPNAQPQPAPELRPPRLGRASKILLALFGITLGAFYLYPQALEALHTYRGRHLLNEARRHIETQRWQQAGEALSVAMPLMPDHPEALRVLVDFLEAAKGNPLRLRDALIRLKEQGKARPNDAVRLARTLLDAGELQGAHTAFGELSPAQRSSAAGQQFEKDLHVLEGRGDPADYALTPEVKSAIGDSNSNFSELQKSALERLWELTRRNDASSLQAIDHLSNLVTLTAPEIEALVTRIEAHPRLNISNRLGVYSGLLRVEPLRRPAILESLMMDYRNASPEDLRVFLQWLAFEGEPSLLRSLVTTSSLYQDASVFTPYAQSLSISKRWRDLITLLEDTTQPLPVSAERTAIWLAEAWSNLEPDMQKAAVQLKRSINFAMKSGNQEALLIAAKEAQKYGLWEIAIRGHTALADSNPKISIPLLEMGLEAATQKGDTEDIYRLTRRLCDLQPKNYECSARLCYLRLLIGDEIETVEVPDVSRVKPAVRSLLLALSAYLIRDHTLLKSHLTAIDSMEDFSPGQKAVYAGMLATCGDLSKAFLIAERIPKAVLLKEEAKLLKAAL